MEVISDQFSSGQPADDSGIEREPSGVGANPATQGMKVEIASVAATATTTTAVIPSADAAEALRLFRSSLLEMVGVPALYSHIPKEKGGGWLRRSAAGDDLSCAALIAKYVSLWSILERPENQKFSVQALIGLQMLQGQSFIAASKVFNEIEFQTSTPAALSYVMKGIGTFLCGLLGVAALIIAAILFLGMILSPDQELALARQINSIDSKWVNVVVAGIAGMLGSVVSLLMRISEFESTRGRSQMFLKLTGATLPIVGGIFGAFIASLFCAQIVNINIGEGGFEGGFSVWAFLVIGFLSGFSERFSRGFVQLAEKRLGGAGQSSGLSVATNATLSETESGSRGKQASRARRRRIPRSSDRANAA
jgi:hypothetical protein